MLMKQPVNMASYVLFILSGLCLIQISLTGTCDKTDGWVWTPFSTCYKTYIDDQDRSSWEEAQAVCQRSNATLVTLETREKINFYRGRRINQPHLRKVPHMWFGGRKIDGKWFWIGQDSKVEITEFNWSKYEPSGFGYKHNIAECINVYGGERCPILGVGVWDDDWCNQNHTFACEKPQKTYQNVLQNQNIVG